MDEQNQTRRTDKGKQILGRSIGDRPGTSSNHVASAPVAVYGFVLLMAAIAYSILQWAIIALEGRESLLAAAIGADWKGKLSFALYLAAIPLAFVSPWIAIGMYVAVALMWLVPDQRIERALEKRRLSRRDT